MWSSKHPKKEEKNPYLFTVGTFSAVMFILSEKNRLWRQQGGGGGGVGCYLQIQKKRRRRRRRMCSC